MIFTATLFWRPSMSLLTFGIFNIGYQLFFGVSRIILFIMVEAIIFSPALAKDPEGLGVVQVVASYYQLQDQEPTKKILSKACRRYLLRH